MWPISAVAWAVLAFAAGFLGLTALGTVLHLLATPHAQRSEEPQPSSSCSVARS